MFEALKITFFLMFYDQKCCLFHIYFIFHYLMTFLFNYHSIYLVWSLIIQIYRKILKILITFSSEPVLVENRLDYFGKKAIKV